MKRLQSSLGDLGQLCNLACLVIEDHGIKSTFTNISGFSFSIGRPHAASAHAQRVTGLFRELKIL